jgi:RimJ/RimL family protein N-acetyltransferase
MELYECNSATVRGDGIVLRAAREDDADDLVRAVDDPLISRFVTPLPVPFTRPDADRWIAGAGAWVIADPQTDRLLGSARLYHLSAQDAKAEVGYWVAPWARGRGVAVAAVRAATAWAFEQGTARVELLAEPENAPSHKVAVRAGFTYEGERRGAAVNRDGSRADLAAWARLATDPAGPSPRRLPDLPAGGLTDGIVRVRPLVADDTDDLFAVMSLPESIRTTVPPVVPVLADVRRRCERASGEWTAGLRARMTIRDAADDAFAGDIGLFWTGPGMEELLVGYGLVPRYRGKGFATRATRLVAGWAFAVVGVPRLVSGTAPENVASQRVLERAGFQREGYERSRLPGVDGGRIDNVLFSLLPGELAPVTAEPARSGTR